MMLVQLICVSVSLISHHHYVSILADDRAALPLDTFLTDQIPPSSNNPTLTALMLQNFVHHGQNIEIEERTLSLCGHSTEIVHTNNLLVPSPNDEDEMMSKDCLNISPIFAVRNSTLSLFDMTLTASTGGSFIARVSSSDVTVSRSDIWSNGFQSPFLVDGGSHFGSCEMLFVEVSHRSENSHLLLPLVSSSFGAQLPSTVSTIRNQLFLRGIALSISNCEMRHSTGPLFDIGTLDDRTDQLNVDCVVALSDCTLRNLTTSDQMLIVDRHLRTAQKVVNCQLSSSFGNIWGAISCGLDTPGSFFVINSSFSNIQPSSLLSPPHSPHTNTNTVFEAATRQEPSLDDFKLISCQFSQIDGTEALIHLNQPLSSSSRTVTLTRCSFCECGRTEGSPSMLLLCGIESVGLFDVSFVRCGGRDGLSIVVISDSIVDSNSSLHFVECGSSELSLTGLVNTTELGMIGDTDSPSPSPFLFPIHQTNNTRRQNSQDLTVAVSVHDTNHPDYYSITLSCPGITGLMFDLTLQGSVYSETETMWISGGFGGWNFNFFPIGISVPDDTIRLWPGYAFCEDGNDYNIVLNPTTFKVPSRRLKLTAGTPATRYNTDYTTDCDHAGTSSNRIDRISQFLGQDHIDTERTLVVRRHRVLTHPCRIVHVVTKCRQLSLHC
ncbi:hypothetical protein BLNAU_18291 [Blattamonas nauphoetae]|uniref:Uncharacterized protein n=1 Tax=Blattamonas nauphoetae TaxID=2049346 RepID=A0ABQ9X4Q7_9EUKA|nr:hypothetical protein BLNAU_18291 [Blattamonas nauphoetae]